MSLVPKALDCLFFVKFERLGREVVRQLELAAAAAVEAPACGVARLELGELGGVSALQLADLDLQLVSKRLAPRVWMLKFPIYPCRTPMQTSHSIKSNQIRRANCAPMMTVRMVERATGKMLMLTVSGATWP